MRIRRRYIKDDEEMNITAFMNLMVILVPFLLITAVFSKIAILELNIPKGDSAAGSKKPELQLQIVLRENLIDVRDGSVGLIKRFAVEGQETKWKALSDLLVQLKNKFPDKENVSILLEPEVPYQLMVKVMDRVKTANIIQPGMTVETIDLFPLISIGDAPVQPAKADDERGVK
ncbi:MAG: biopolymer transporter ExbD [Gammaproteobacteria bacterium]|nr:biopolymer transporter ExbD [Gammaproteobacteria bacterium]